MADDTRVTRVRRGLVLALPLVCLYVALPSAFGAAGDPQPDPKLPQQWGLQDINAPAAWRTSTGAGVTVAVVDTGITARHEDLIGHIAPGGWGLEGSIVDESGHGTEVSGVIAATKDNGLGIAGVAPDASILPIRAFKDTESVSVEDLLGAMDRAGDSGARVVNLSLSSEPMGPAERKTSAVRRQMRDVLAKHPNTLYVAAAGNGLNGVGTDNDREPVFPCSADATNLICVGASQQTPQGTRPWSGSNYGRTSVDIFAPGTGIFTTALGSSSYTDFTGTSAATPFVSGEAALLFSKVPRLTPEGAIRLILSTSRFGALFAGKSASGGGPDAAAALAEATVDQDGDGVYDVVDACPQQAYATETGCAAPGATPTPAATPTPTPVATPRPAVPQLRSVTTTVSRCKATKKSCRTSATVRLKPDRTATVSLRVERQICTKRGRCRWTPYMTKAFSATVSGASVVVRGKRMASLPKGSYRVVVVPSSSAGAGKPVTRTFRVR
jgi:subtilisin family serine protease